MNHSKPIGDMIFKEIYDEKHRFVALKAYDTSPGSPYQGFPGPLQDYKWSYLGLREQWKEARGQRMGLDDLLEQNELK